MSEPQAPQDKAFDRLDFVGRMAAIAELVRQYVAAAEMSASKSAATDFQALTNVVKQTLYNDYSLWDAEFDAIERVVRRALAEAIAQRKMSESAHPVRQLPKTPN